MELDKSKIDRLYWAEKYNVGEIANKLGISFWTVYNFMNRNNIDRRGRSEANYVGNKHKLHFEIKDKLTLKDRELKIVGIILYWAEGSKNLKSNMLDFCNSDPAMIGIFMKFLRQVCGIKESRLRVYLYAYSYQRIEELKNYWHKVTGISKDQFIKPYIRKGNPNLSGRKLPHGLVHIRYSDQRLLQLVLNWIEEFKSSLLLNRAGGGVAYRTRL